MNNEEYFEEGMPEEVELQTEDVTDKKCPGCGATVTYDPETLKMTCDFCGYSRELPQPTEGNDPFEELDFESATIRKTKDWGSQVRNLICKQCGASTVYDASQTAGSCPFCGSTSVMPVDDEEDVMAPGGVVPFEISRDRAAFLFKNWMKMKIFVPSKAKKECEAKEFTGLYLPYWTFDSQTTSSYKASLGYEYRNGKGETRVRWKKTRGIYEEFIDDEVVLASLKQKNPYIKHVSNYNFEKLREYSPELMAGFVAERYTLGLDDGWKVARNQIQKKLERNISKYLKKAHRADRVAQLVFSTEHANVTFKYVLAPIWIATYKYKEKVYSLAVNGQSGKVIGNAPISPLKVGIAILIFIAIIALCLYFQTL